MISHRLAYDGHEEPQIVLQFSRDDALTISDAVRALTGRLDQYMPPVFREFSRVLDTAAWAVIEASRLGLDTPGEQTAED